MDYAVISRKRFWVYSEEYFDLSKCFSTLLSGELVINFGTELLATERPSSNRVSDSFWHFSTVLEICGSARRWRIYSTWPSVLSWWDCCLCLSQFIMDTFCSRYEVWMQTRVSKPSAPIVRVLSPPSFTACVFAFISAGITVSEWAWELRPLILIKINVPNWVTKPE